MQQGAADISDMDIRDGAATQREHVAEDNSGMRAARVEAGQ